MNKLYFISSFIGSFVGLIYYFSRLPNYYFMEKIKNPRKRKAVEEAENYIEEYGYVNIGWFIKTKLEMKVKGVFISSVAALMTRHNLYIKERTNKNDFRIEKNPNYTKPSKILIFFNKYIWTIIAALVATVVGGWILHHFLHIG